MAAMIAVSCAEPEDFTAGNNKPYGSWAVAEFYVNGQTDGSGLLSRFVLERDGNFILEDNNGVVFVGNWESTDTSLTLTESGDSTSQVFSYDIITATSNKMHLVQSIESLDLEVRYLMNNGNLNTY